MSKLYFSINKNETGELCNVIFNSKTKTTAKNELRDQGLVPKLVLTWQDIVKIQSNQFQNNDMTEELKNYVLAHADEWEKRMNHAENEEGKE